ncbi:MAG: ChbG/HpnK family deacetylase [Rhodoferax sp.]|nr:ChbG/HpnK family deacetylase [Rhodoferax sp.]
MRNDGGLLMRQLVLCADDFAVHEAASRGIADLARQGRLSATSVMVLSERWPRDAALLRPLRGRIDVGLHLDWTSEFARRAGHGMSVGAAMLRASLGGFDRGAARTVVDRQLDAFEAQWGFPPDHVDGHQHVQQFAGIRDALVAAVCQRYGARAPYLRVSRPVPGQADLKSRVISAMGAQALQSRARQAHIGCAPHLGGVYDFDADYPSRMDRWLAQAPSGTLIMCHPADAAASGDVIGTARAREYAHLRSDAFAQQLSAHQIELVRGGALYTGSRT